MFLRLLVLDYREKKVRQLNLPVDLLVLDEDSGELTLRHFFGDGGRKGCQRVAAAAADLLECPIKHYLALDVEKLRKLREDPTAEDGVMTAEDAVRILKEELREEKDSIVGLYKNLEAYILTDMGRGMVNEVLSLESFDRETVQEIRGTSRMDSSGDVQFMPEASALREALIELMYEKKE